MSVIFVIKNVGKKIMIQAQGRMLVNFTVLCNKLECLSLLVYTCVHVVLTKRIKTDFKGTSLSQVMFPEWRHDTWHISIMTIGITKIIITKNVTLGINSTWWNDTQHNNSQSSVPLCSVFKFCIVILSVVFLYCNA